MTLPRSSHWCRRSGSPVFSPTFRYPVLIVLCFLLAACIPSCTAAEDTGYDAGVDLAGPEVNLTDTELYAYGLVNKGVECSYMGNYSCALSSFDEAHRALPNDTSILYNYAVALSILERYDEAIAKLDAALTLEPENANLWYAKGAILKNAGDYAGSGESFERAEELDPEIGVTFADHYPYNLILITAVRNISLVVLLAGFLLLGIYIWFNERKYQGPD